MNDPFECLAFVKRQFTHAEITAFRKRGSNSSSKAVRQLALVEEKKFTEYFNVARSQALSKWVFCSLSEVPDDILMWSHYANGHKGIVIAFEFSSTKLANFHQVKYANKLPEFCLLDYIDFMEGNDAMGHMMIKDLSIKSVEWSREKEWRVWGKKPGYYRYEKSEIKEVYFGINCEFEVVALVRKILGEDVRYYEMEFRDDPLRLVKE